MKSRMDIEDLEAACTEWKAQVTQAVDTYCEALQKYRNVLNAHGGLPEDFDSLSAAEKQPYDDMLQALAKVAAVPYFYAATAKMELEQESEKFKKNNGGDDGLCSASPSVQIAQHKFGVACGAVLANSVLIPPGLFLEVLKYFEKSAPGVLVVLKHELRPGGSLFRYADPNT